MPPDLIDGELGEADRCDSIWIDVPSLEGLGWVGLILLT